MGMNALLKANALDLEKELTWLSQVVDVRFKSYFETGATVVDIYSLSPPDLSQSDSAYAHCINEHQLGFEERAALILSLTPYIRPQLLDVFFYKNPTFDRRFSEFGGFHQEINGHFIPTGETLLFLLAANDLERRFSLQLLFNHKHIFAQQHILSLLCSNGDTTSLNTPLRVSEEYLGLLTTGIRHQPDFNTHFPAHLIETQLQWDDLVLHPGTRKQIEEIETWIRHGATLMHEWGMAAKLRPGFRSLFYGPPGTGKTMTACLLGNATGHAVYKIDLSLVVSKYIGETEKNLAKIFDHAEHRNWILFFDEADALFGKRSETRNAHDHYANQETAFLLQRIETFDGIAILASNFRENLDEAFARRFESIIYFPLPSPEERLQLWRLGFSQKARLAETIDLPAIARDHNLSGSSIMNAIRYASLESLRRGSETISLEEVQQGIRREYSKERKGG
jgi:AAA+ superfamily predicted ATPase